MAGLTSEQRTEIQGVVLASVQEAMRTASKTPDLNAAYFAAWHDAGNVGKNAVNPHHKNNYANLEAVMAVVKPVMKANGLVLIQTPGPIRDGNQQLLTVLLHAPTGQSWNFLMEIPLGEKRTAQSTGSGLTYARRYFILTLFGMCPVDDDGESASEPAPEEEEQEVVVDPKALITAMNKWAKGKKGKEASAAFTTEFKEAASGAGAETAKAFVELRGLIKNG